MSKIQKIQIQERVINKLEIPEYKICKKRGIGMTGGALPVRLEKSGRVAIITIDNPPVNALDMATLDSLDQTLNELADEKQLMAVIITGAGERVFAAGFDIKVIPTLDEVSGRQVLHRGQYVMQKIADLPVPAIAAINGVALGGGCELALACDMRVAAANARLGLPEVNLGAIPGFGGTQRLPRMLPLAIALEMIYTGRLLNADEAYRVGLVNRVVEPGRALEEAKRMASEIASKGPLAIRAAKRAVRLGLQYCLRDALALEAELMAQLYSSEDLKEGVRAFLEKRTPIFSGR